MSNAEIQNTAAADCRWDAVLVDDDPLVHLTWKLSARTAAKQLLGCRSASELRAQLPALPRSTPLYLDSHLGEGISGEELATELQQAGFTELHIVSGYEAVRFSHLAFLRSVLGKNPPW